MHRLSPTFATAVPVQACTTYIWHVHEGFYYSKCQVKMLKRLLDSARAPPAGTFLKHNSFAPDSIWEQFQFGSKRRRAVWYRHVLTSTYLAVTLFFDQLTLSENQLTSSALGIRSFSSTARQQWKHMVFSALHGTGLYKPVFGLNWFSGLFLQGSRGRFLQHLLLLISVKQLGFILIVWRNN